MKRIFAIVALATVALLGLQSCEKDDNYINESLLPTEAQTFINTYFASVPIKNVIKDFDDFTYTYKVHLDDGTFIEFNKEGKWRDVKNHTTGVPNSIVPQKIVEYLTANYPNNFMADVERGRHYDVELNDGLDLDFSLDGDFLRIDR